MPSPITRRQALIGGATGLSVGLPGCQSVVGLSPELQSWSPESGTWPTTRYNSRNTNFNPHARAPRDAVEPAWTRKTNLWIYGLLVVDSYLIVYGRGGVRVYERGQTRPVWQTDRDVRAAGCSPPSDDGARVLYLIAEQSDDEAIVSGLTLNGFERVLEISFPHRTSVVGHTVLPTASNLFVGSNGDVSFTVLDPHRGTIRWSGVGAHPAVADDRAYAAGRGVVSAHRTRRNIDQVLNGPSETVWKTSDIHYGEYVYTPAIANGRVLVGSYGTIVLDELGGALNGYDVATGEPLWDPFELGWAVSTPAVVDDVGFVTASEKTAVDGQIAAQPSRHIALDLDDGTILWEQPTEWGLNEPSPGPIVAGNNTVVVYGGKITETGDTGFLHAFDADRGDELWTASLSRTVNAAVLVGTTIYVGTRDGTVRALESTNK